MGRWTIGAACAVLAILVSLKAQPAAPARVLRVTDIEPGGAAEFVAELGDRRSPGWTVSCSAPLRGCVARSHGAVLRLDDGGNVWLALATSSDARLSIRGGLFDEVDATRLLRHPVDADLLSRLSRPGGELVIDDPRHPTAPLQTGGLDHVVSYLAWVQSPLARGLRDARLWPMDGKLNLDNADPEVRERYRLMRMRAGTGEDGGRIRIVPPSS